MKPFWRWMVILPTEIGIEQIYIEAINDLIIKSA